VIFVPKYVSRVVFKGGILGTACQFWGNPYLNSTTVLFDEKKSALYSIGSICWFVTYNLSEYQVKVFFNVPLGTSSNLVSSTCI